MVNYDFNLRKMLIYCLMVLSSFALACDDDDDDIDIIPDDEVEFNNIQLLGANEIPAITSPGSGNLNATYNEDTNIMTFSISWTLGSITDVVTAMHFHGPASVTEEAPPVIPVTPTTTSYQGSFSGTTRALTDAEEADLLAGRWYFNIHSTTYPDGELRGQLVE